MLDEPEPSISRYQSIKNRRHDRPCSIAVECWLFRAKIGEIYFRSPRDNSVKQGGVRTCDRKYTGLQKYRRGHLQIYCETSLVFLPVSLLLLPFPFFPFFFLIHLPLFLSVENTRVKCNQRRWTDRVDGINY